MLAGCHNEIENELGLLERRIAALEEKCSQMNITLNSLQSILDKLNKYDFITGVRTIYNGGDILGYTISFTNSPSISIYNGQDAETPVIGVKKGDDGIYYWTIRYADGTEEFILNNFGQKVSSAAICPILKIENGNWMVSYDNGEIWHNMGQATGTSGTSFIKDVQDSTDYIKFNFLDGTAIRIPTWTTFENLKAEAKRANDNYSSLQTLISNLKDNLFAQNTAPILSGADTIGYRIYLSDGTSLPFYNGLSTNIPTISARKDTLNPNDSSYYWTIKYPGDKQDGWILVGGNKVRASAESGVTPLIGFEKFTDNLYYWTISYDGGSNYTWILNNGQKVVASAPKSNPFVSQIVNINTNVIQITIGGVDYFIPRYKAIPVSIAANLRMAASSTYDLPYSLPEGNSDTELLVVTNDGFYARIIKTDHTSGIIRITSPATFTTGTSSLMFMISDGMGALKTVSITIYYGV